MFPSRPIASQGGALPLGALVAAEGSFFPCAREILVATAGVATKGGLWAGTGPALAGLLIAIQGRHPADPFPFPPRAPVGRHVARATWALGAPQAVPWVFLSNVEAGAPLASRSAPLGCSIHSPTPPVSADVGQGARPAGFPPFRRPGCPALRGRRPSTSAAASPIEIHPSPPLSPPSSWLES